MADLKSLFNTFKLDGVVLKKLDQYLLSLDDTDSDRATDVNSPSQVGVCMRARYYARKNTPRDGNSIDARTRRIFDNGTKTHERIQEYLEKQGMLLMAEVPVFNSEYNILGSSDGIVTVDSNEVAVLELKSINSNGFSRLTDVREDHFLQGLVYVFCLETHRLSLRESYPEESMFVRSRASRRKLYAKMYQHLQDGAKYTREEKIAYRVDTHLKLDNILYKTEVPLTKAVFLYENKDTQDMKEFIVTSGDSKAKDAVETFKVDYATLNQCVESNTLPPRCGKDKTDYCCRWCDFKTECWR